MLIPTDDLTALIIKAEARKNIPRQYDAERDLYYIDTTQLQDSFADKIIYNSVSIEEQQSLSDLTTPQSLLDKANTKKGEPIFYDNKKDLCYTKISTDGEKNNIEGLGKEGPPKIPPIFGERCKEKVLTLSKSDEFNYQKIIQDINFSKDLSEITMHDWIIYAKYGKQQDNTEGRKKYDYIKFKIVDILEHLITCQENEPESLDERVLITYWWKAALVDNDEF
jgi:hypothetical protein